MNEGGPIGVLDSGVGGLAVLRVALNSLPGEDYLYLGDSRYFPYGDKEPGFLRRRVRKLIGFLYREGAKAVMLACNTASAIVLPLLGDAPLPVVGVIRAGARLAALSTRRGKVGVLATVATVRSGAYERAVREEGPPGIEVVSRAAPELVERMERSFRGAEEVEDALLRAQVDPLVEEGVDVLVLGCTHFLPLRDRVARLYPQVQVVDPAREAVRELESALRLRGMLRSQNGFPRRRFVVSGDPFSFREVGSGILGTPIGEVEPLLEA
jgi:glutamate racemase